MSNPKFRNKFSKIDRVPAPVGTESRTQQHMKDAVNINNILAKYRKTGVIEHVKRAQARYGDFLDLAEYGVHLDKAAKAKQSFEMLPAELRNRFQNSIPGFFEFIQNPTNKEECIRMGIFNPPPPLNTDKAGSPAASEPSPQSNKNGSIKKSKTVSSSEEEP